MARAGRRPGQSGNRERIATAAREVFGEAGFEGATIRMIAARARVDPALVHHYFGSKQRLFLSVMNLPFDMGEVMNRLLAAGRDGLGERLIAFFLSLWDEQPRSRAILSGIIRSASTDLYAAELMREFLGRQGLFELVRSIADDRHDVR